MVTQGVNAFPLMTLGAGFFALSFVRGRAGKLAQSILFAALAAILGGLKAIDGGVLARNTAEMVAVFGGYFLLALSGVLVSRRMYEASQKNEE